MRYGFEGKVKVTTVMMLMVIEIIMSDNVVNDRTLLLYSNDDGNWYRCGW